MKPTTVVKVSGRKRDLFLADPEFVYVGRSFGGFIGGIFGNPYRKPTIIGSAVFMFASELMIAIDHPGFAEMQFDRRAEALPTLQGKKLGCWCLDWDGTGEPPIECHAVVLALAADGRLEEIREFLKGDQGRPYK